MRRVITAMRAWAVSRFVRFGAIWVLSIVVGVLSARAAGTEPREAPHLEAARRVAAAVEVAAVEGLDTTRGHQIGAALSGRSIGAIPTLISGYMLAVAQSRGISSPVVLRLGTVVVGAAAVPLLYVLGEWALGPWGGVLAAALLLSCPRFVHDLGTAGSDAPLVAAWLLVLVPYVASTTGRMSPSTGALATGMAFAVGLLIDEATTWTLCAIGIHFVATRGTRISSELRRGNIELPSVWVGMLVLGAAMLVGFWSWASDNPFLPTGPLMTRWTSADLRWIPPNGRGSAGSFSPPWFFGPAVLALAFQGPAMGLLAIYLVRLIVRGLDRMPTRDGLRTLRKWLASNDVASGWLGGFVVIGLFQSCFVAPFAPGSLARLPPYVSVGLPFTALLVAWGVVQSFRALTAKDWRWPTSPIQKNALVASVLSLLVVLPGAVSSMRATNAADIFETAILMGGPQR